MRFTVYTLFPGLVTPYLQEALLARAVREGIVTVEVRDLRRFAGNRTGRVDDAPYGGGAGMVMRVDVAAAAIDEAYADDPPPDEVVLLSPAGERLTQRVVEELATRRHVCLLSARYEGFDARVEGLVTREVSIGDFVLMGGELPALCVVEAVTRLLPGALGDEESHRQDSFASGLLDYPEYTRPAEFRGLGVPEVLLSGHHAKVAAWRRREALRRTLQRRPDLLETADLTPEDERELASLRAELAARAAPAVNGDGQDDEAGR
ncbi:MAG TPA: tRNA (guanosine(37)-N1)-methyltransferase TrmD [Trueperaceae bacterium]|nr:tRNA (guanosine(37)-N1)-methyltransferase TrmD [Trueperaceae bacterium]